MGFTAPSAAAVYGYLLGGGPSPALTDRFGWSILLVNDSSRVCADLLDRHAEELCARTGGRVRFGFFTGVPQERLDYLAKRGGAAQTGSSWLRTVLDVVARPRSGLRPPAYSRSGPQIALDRSPDTRLRAVPGADAAARFARRLGIGPFVPCLVMVTDAGERRIHVLRLAGRGADAVHARVLSWIDAYHEQNRAVLERWTAVEEAIAACARAARTSLSTVRTWPESRRADLAWLARIAGLLLDLEGGGRDGIRRIRQVYGAPAPLRHVLIDLETALGRSDQQERAARACAALSAEIDSAPDDRLRAVLGRMHAQCPDDVRRRLREAAATLGRSPSPCGAADELARWWRNAALPLVSRREFGRWTRALPRPLAAPVDAAAWHVAYAVFRRALGALPLAGSPGDPVTPVVDALATCAPAEVWRDGARALAPPIGAAVQRLRSTAPPWLADRAPAATIGDVVPIGASYDRETLRAFVASSPLLAGLVRLRPDPAERVRATVGAALLDAAGRLPEEARTGRRAAYAAARTALERVHAELAASLERSVAAGPPPGPGRRETGALLAALDEYDTAVAAIRYPYMRDPEVIELTADLDPFTAADLGHGGGAATTDRLRRELAAAEEAADEAERLREAARAAGARYTPLAELRARLEAALPGGRVEELLAAGDALAAAAALREAELTLLGGEGPLSVEERRALLLAEIGVLPPRAEDG
ncbi:hypothetical protein ACQP00_27920 [Dactylosporangium sp. CS-047395]|uniref:hypothetical protein n=1 Tax=Dactylosporangium sp. CS-047395 TaxID=3239936 RepID=UPI003D901E9E